MTDLFSEAFGDPPPDSRPAPAPLEAPAVVAPPVAPAAPISLADMDPLQALARAIDRVERDLATLHPSQVAARRQSYAAIATFAGRMDTILSKRPRVTPPNEVHEALRGASGTCVELLLRHTREAAAKFARDRAALVQWATEELPPKLAAELVRRMDNMLGGAPS